MFTKIMVPVDLVHRDTVSKATEVACKMAKDYGAELFFVSVSGGLPSEIASSSGEYGHKLEDFAEYKGQQFGITAHAVNLESPDPPAEMDSRLQGAIKDLEVDLVVMASRQPGLMDYIFGTHGGHMATHAQVSVFVVR